MLILLDKLVVGKINRAWLNHGEILVQQLNSILLATVSLFVRIAKVNDLNAIKIILNYRDVGL